MADKKTEADFEKRIVQKIYDSIANLDGISKLVGGGFTDNLTNTILGRESFIPGIWIDKAKDKYLIGIRIKVFYGINIPQLSYDIQTRAKSSLSEDELELIKSINISVEGIDKAGDIND